MPHLRSPHSRVSERCSPSHPEVKGGKATEYLHRICHRQIHALFTETELATQLNTASALQEHPQMQRFIHWVKTKPDHFFEKSRKSARLKE